jgi:hypothetical protein
VRTPEHRLRLDRIELAERAVEALAIAEQVDS